LPPSLPYSSSKKHLPFRLIAQCIETTKKTGVIVTGAGLAGLVAATRLNSQNIPFLLLEASDAVGCRVWTDLLMAPALTEASKSSSLHIVRPKNFWTTRSHWIYRRVLDDVLNITSYVHMDAEGFLTFH